MWFHEFWRVVIRLMEAEYGIEKSSVDRSNSSIDESGHKNLLARGTIRGSKNLLTAACFLVMRFFTYTYAQYASMNEFTCSEHSVCIRRSKKRSTGNQPLLGEMIKVLY